jgi:hemoglobin
MTGWHPPAWQSAAHMTPEPLEPAIPAETIYEHAGGDAGLRAIVSSFYDSIFEDPLLQPVFGHPVATHVDHLTAFLAEEFGGPARYTDELGGFPKIVSVHRNRKITEPQRQRFVELFMAAVTRPALPTILPFRKTVKSAIEFGTRIAIVNSNATTDDELHPQRVIPHWRW